MEKTRGESLHNCPHQEGVSFSRWLASSPRANVREPTFKKASVWRESWVPSAIGSIRKVKAGKLHGEGEGVWLSIKKIKKWNFSTVVCAMRESDGGTSGKEKRNGSITRKK